MINDKSVITLHTVLSVNTPHSSLLADSWRCQIPVLVPGLGVSLVLASRQISPVSALCRSLVLLDGWIQTTIQLGSSVSTHTEKCFLFISGKLGESGIHCLCSIPGSTYFIPGSVTLWSYQYWKIDTTETFLSYFSRRFSPVI